MKTLAVITPTISRPTLRRAILSARLTERDEWLVIGDGPQPEAEQVCRDLVVLPYLRYVEGPKTGKWGYKQRDVGMRLANADYLLFLDDDDVFTSGAIQAIRGQINGNPFIFRAWHNGHIIWTSRFIEPGNVASGMFVLPNDPARLARWADDQSYPGDTTFMQRTMKFWDNSSLIWAGEITQIHRPETSDEWDHLA